jgi:probable F420-dependent oxidoreductase
MKFGLRYCNTARYVDPKEAVALAQAAETAGFESLWTVEHTIVPAGYASAYPYDPSGKMAGGRNDMPLPDPLIWMAFVAAATTKIKLATGILILPQHNPVLAAKQIATLDHMSRGRILLGVGVGWLQEEFAALGVPFAERGARMDEYISAMRELWSADKPTFKGRFVAFEGAYCRPQPVNKSVPIIVGGHSEAAARRAGRLGDGFFPARGVAIPPSWRSPPACRTIWPSSMRCAASALLGCWSPRPAARACRRASADPRTSPAGPMSSSGIGVCKCRRIPRRR